MRREFTTPGRTVSAKGTMLLMVALMMHSVVFSQSDSTISHYVTFESDVPQFMWGPEPGKGINDTIEIFPRFYQNFQFDTRPGSIFKFGGLKFGAGLYGGFEFGLGPMQFRISDFELGSVDVKYPIKVDLSIPEDSSFNAGDTITIKSEYTVEPGYELNTVYPTDGEIALEMPILFDIRVGTEFCIFDCFDMMIIPPANIPAPPLVDMNWVIFGVNSEEITYPCLNFPPTCSQDISLSLPGNTPLSGNLSIPNVTTTVALDGKDLVATGSDVYVDASLDVIQMLSYLPPPAGSVFTAVSGGIQLPPGGVPDFGGTRRYLNIDWTLFTMNLGFPISQNQEFRFSPKVNLKLDFPVETEYLIKDNERGTSVSGNASTVEVPVGADLTIRYPCDYAFMDINAAYTIDRTGDNFSNRTFDHVDVELIFTALEFAVSFDQFDIIPRTCISIPFVGKFCIELSLPGFSFPIGPLVEPDPIHLAGFDFPPYFNDSWNIGGFSEIPIPEPFRITPRKFRIDALANNVSCFGQSGGSVAINVTGATAPLSYLWSDGSKTKDLLNAPAGKYYVAVKDKNGCRVIANTEITQPPAIVTSVAGTDLICHADNSGTAMVTVSGGVTGYSYLWEYNSSNSSTNTGLPAGTHKVIVTDGNGCIKTDSILLKEPRPIRSSIVKTIQPSCAGYTDGSIFTDVSGGVEPYAYQWSGGQTTPDIIGIGEGNYSLNISDKHGCTSSQTATLIAPQLLDLSLNVTRHVKCYEGRDGEIQAAVSGGTLPYDYHWLNNSVTLSEKGPVLHNVTASVYTLEITDKKGCKTNKNVTVTQPASRLTIAMNTTDALCYNSNTGRLEALVYGGTPPYGYLWSNGDYDNVAENLDAGKYTVEVADANGCTIRSQGVIVQPSQIKIFLSAEDISCSEQTDGYIKSEVAGGNPPYQYTWSNGVSDTIIQQLPEGVYSLSVTDQSGCSAYASADIGKREGECLFIPTAFSPNNDGVNDTWVIRNIQLYPNSNVRVFNKWGQLLFESSPYFSPWDGTYKGELLPPATYYCVVDTGDGKEVYSGPLTIVK